MEDNEYFVVTTTDNMGNDMVAYVAADDLREYSQMMSSEYGNIKVEPIAFEDIPVDAAADMQNDNK